MTGKEINSYELRSIIRFTNREAGSARNAAGAGNAENALQTGVRRGDM